MIENQVSLIIVNERFRTNHEALSSNPVAKYAFLFFALLKKLIDVCVAFNKQFILSFTES